MTRENLFRKFTIAALVSVLLLIFVGATVRVTGAGMGCPDWPTCWGLLIPPTHVDQVDFDSLPIEKFQKKAERMGRSADSVTRETLAADFNPRHIWTEFVNRLTSLPVGFFTLGSFILSFWFIGKFKRIFVFAFTSLFLVLANALMGARVVYSGLAPGIISLHLGLAMILICTLTYSVWFNTGSPKKLSLSLKPKTIKWLVTILLFSVVFEGIIGSQIREMTDDLAKSDLAAPRNSWIEQLEGSTLYLLHRSFSWVIFFVTLVAYYLSKKSQGGHTNWQQRGVMGIVFAQMILGVIMAQVHIYSFVQVLHVGLAALLLSLVFWWFLLIPKKSTPART